MKQVGRVMQKTTVACFSEEFQEETLEMGNERRSWRPMGDTRRALDFVLCAELKKKYQEPKRRNKRRVPTKIPKGVRNYCLASTAASRGCCYGFLVGSLYIKSPFTLWLKYGFARYAIATNFLGHFQCYQMTQTKEYWMYSYFSLKSHLSISKLNLAFSPPVQE